MAKSDDPRCSSTDGVVPGFEDEAAPGPLKENGQHASYWILSEEERAKGFVRPVRHSYVHDGPQGPTHPTRDLTDEEKARYEGVGYVAFEVYGEEESPVVGHFWTQAQLDAVGNGCGVETRMSNAIAQTYARDPSFYGSTFCVSCKDHLPVAEFRWSNATKGAEGSVLGS